MKNLAILLFIFISSSVYAQKYETLKKIEIPKHAIIVKTVKVEGCETKIDSGYIVKTEFTKKNQNKTYTVTKFDTLTKNTTYHTDKEVSIKIRNFSGVANLTSDENDKKSLLVNYWLNPEQTIKVKKKSPRKLVITKKTLKCPVGKDVQETDYVPKTETKVIVNDTILYLYKVELNEYDSIKKEDWFVHTDKIIEVYTDNKSDKIDYYLVNKYDRNANYRIKFENRDFISYTKSSIAFGPITVPFKYRFGYSKDSIDVKQQFDADLNVGVFGGYQIGKHRVRLEGNSFKKLSNVSATLGAFLSLGSIKLDKTNTTTDNKPLIDEETSTIGILSPGIGMMLDVYNVNIGAFVGMDVGFGNDSKRWNFNNRPWIGFGLGYSLSGFWKE